MWNWGKTCGSLDAIPSVTMGSCKSKTDNDFYYDFNSALTPKAKGATTKIQVKKYKGDINI